MSAPILILTILGIFALLIAAIRVFAKGSKFYELTSLPLFWYRLLNFKIQPMWEQRYDYGEQRRQYLLFLKPENQKITKQNIVIYLHGGAWLLGKPEFFRPNAQSFVEQGYGVILPSYRRVPKYSYTDMREDLNEMMCCIQNIVEEHNLHDKKFILGGVSAGGHLAAHWLYNRAALEQCGWSQDHFSGIFMLASPLDLEQMKKTMVLNFYTKGKFQDANPINYLQVEEDLPMLCIQGGKDGLVTYESATTFVDRYQKIDKDLVQFHRLEEATHLDTSRWAYQEDEVKKLILDWVKEVEASTTTQNIESTNQQFNKSTTI
ncbi:MAG: alpha/beta hydrolase [Bacteroidota bacterium]